MYQKYAFLIMFIFVLSIVPLPEVKASHRSCPCYTEYVGTLSEIDNMIYACNSCTNLAISEHNAQSSYRSRTTTRRSSRKSYSAGDIQRARTEARKKEIRRQNEIKQAAAKRKRKARKREQAKIKAKQAELKNLLAQNTAKQKYGKDFGNMINVISELIYMNRNNIKAGDRYRSLKDRLFKERYDAIIAAGEKRDKALTRISFPDYQKQQQERLKKNLEATWKADAAKRKAAAAEIEKVRAEKQKFREAATNEALGGKIKDEFYTVLDSLYEKDQLSAEDKELLSNMLSSIDYIISESQRQGGDPSVIRELIRLKEQYSYIGREGGPIREGVQYELDRSTGPSVPVDNPRTKALLEKSSETVKANKIAWGDYGNMINDWLYLEEDDEELITNAIDLREKLLEQEKSNELGYQKILDADKNNVLANYYMAETLNNQRRFDEAKLFQLRAFAHANPAQRDDMNTELRNKFLDQLKINRPPKKLGLLQRLGRDFSNRFLTEANKAHPKYDAYRDSEKMNKVTEWQQRKILNYEKYMEGDDE